jgi:hypothetical protein
MSVNRTTMRLVKPLRKRRARAVVLHAAMLTLAPWFAVAATATTPATKTAPAAIATVKAAPAKPTTAKTAQKPAAKAEAKKPVKQTANAHASVHAVPKHAGTPVAKTTAIKSTKNVTSAKLVKEPAARKAAVTKTAKAAAPALKPPSKADYEAAARVHAWEAAHHNDVIATAVVARANPVQESIQDANLHRKATADDFLQAATQTTAEQKPEAAEDTAAESKATAAENKSEEASAGDATQTSAENTAGHTASSAPTVTPALDDSTAPVTKVELVYNQRGHLVVPPALKGTHDILVHQNEVADSEGLDRVKDDADLERLRKGKLLVAIPENDALQVDERLPEDRRFCRPWAAKFLADLARAHYVRFHTPLQVNSAVRTVEFQEHLLRTNGNAAPADGETASPHLTGQAVDLAKHGLSLTEIAWMRGYLLPLVQSGKIDVEEEFQQSCFHISVYKKYMPAAATPKHKVQPKAPTAMLATGLQ